MRRRPGIDPLPPVAVGVAMPWDAPVGDAVATLAAARARLGDTFVVDSGEDRWLLTFSPAGCCPETCSASGTHRPTSPTSTRRWTARWSSSARPAQSTCST